MVHDRDKEASGKMLLQTTQDVAEVMSAAQQGRLMRIVWERQSIPDREKLELDPDHDAQKYGDVIKVTFVMRPVK